MATEILYNMTTVSGTIVFSPVVVQIVSGSATIPATGSQSSGSTSGSSPAPSGSVPSTGSGSTSGSVPSTSGSVTSSSLYFVWKNGLQNGFRDYSYNGTYSTDAAGDKVGNVGAYGAISFNALNNVAIDSSKYLGVQFDLKTAVNESLNISLTNGQTTVVTKAMTGSTTMKTYQVSWSDLALPAFSTFTNVLFENRTGTALSGAVTVNNVALIVNPNPQSASVVLPPLDPNPVSASSAGTLWLHVSGNQILDENNVRWMGRGVNIFDTKLDGAGIATDPVTAAKEVIRRIDWAAGQGVDYFRLLLQALNSSGQVSNSATLINDPAYLAAVKSIVEHIGTIPGARVEITVDIDPSLNPQVGGQPTIATQAMLTQLVYSFYKCSYVLFGCCNEPANNAASALPDLLNVFNTCVKAVRTAEAKVGSKPHIVVVQGVNNYSREIQYFLTNPVVDSANMVAYETHLYDHVNDSFWTEYVNCAAKIPVIVGEFGVDPSGFMTSSDASAFMSLAESLKTSYTGWALDQEAAPAMLNNVSGYPAGIGMPLQWNAWGLQFINALRAAKGLPAVKSDGTLA